MAMLPERIQSMTSPAPAEAYARRLQDLRQATARYQRWDQVLGIAKLGLAVAAIILGVWLIKIRPASIFWETVPAVLFVALAVTHERVLSSLRSCTRLVTLYERGIARLEDRWAGSGSTGERFLDPAHPYARDLDLFGSGGLFELLCVARTRMGEDTLASWLLSAAPREEVRQRQAAIRELSGKSTFREQLATSGEDVRVGLHPEALIRWSETETSLQSRFLNRGAPVLAALWILSLIAWKVWGWGSVALAMSLVNLAITFKYRPQVLEAVAGIDGAAHDLSLLSSLLGSIEKESFAAEKLVALHAKLRVDGAPPSKSVSLLEKRVNWLDSHDNWFIKVLDPFIFWTPQCVRVIEAWRKHYGPAVRGWLTVVGEIEALSSLAGYAYEQHEDVFPELADIAPYLEAADLAHPLIPRRRAVANSLKLDSELQLMMISGSNMAGKSTFIRAVGVNAVLAQCGAPVRARSMTLSSLIVAASICILDSLQGGLSRFYAEIRRLKQIDDLSRGETPVLFLLDELLSGTNSHDRRIGTESVIRSLLRRGATGLVTTHDLALTEIAGRMEHGANYHFGDRFQDGELRFDYRLRPGVVETTNALDLMRAVGLEILPGR
jgi:hypothetical protein